MSTPPEASPCTAVVYVHEPEKGLGTLGPALRRAGFRLEERLREPRPGDAGAPLVVVMGGTMGAYEEERHPYLAGEREVLARRLEAGRPTLGICLGAQLLAAAAGARVHAGEPGPVLGVAPVTLTPEGLADPLFAGFEERFEVLHWHADTFTPVPGAQVLASSARYPCELFRLGTSYGVQFHPEVDGRAFEGWVQRHPEALARLGLEAGRLLARERPRLARAQQPAGLLLERLALFFARRLGVSTAGERYLFTVAAVNRLEGRAVVLSPGIPRRAPIVRVGQAVALARPDGSRVAATVRGMASFGDTGAAIPLLVQLETEAELPAGTEVLTHEPLTV